MKLLFDENLSPRLTALLATEYPGSAHVHLVGLGAALDADVWAYARAEGYVVVSKNADFFELSVVRGAPQSSCGSAGATVLRPTSSRYSKNIEPKSSSSRSTKQDATL